MEDRDTTNTAREETAAPRSERGERSERSEHRGERSERGEHREHRSDHRGEHGKGNGKKKFFRKKLCFFCSKKIKVLDYKNTDLLRRFITEHGKILPRRITGTCAKHQRLLSTAINRARIVALLPFTDR
jgi:small subunit ribosomal protein S18